MCTTYTWLAYQWPERRPRPPSTGRVTPRIVPPRTMPPCVRDEDADGDAVCSARRPLRRRRRARHWVGLAIVGVQMAAWCLVGALLMHRGVTNLKRREAAVSMATTTAPEWTLQQDEDDAPSPAPPSRVSTTPMSTLTGNSVAEDDSTKSPVEDRDDDVLEDSLRDLARKGWSSFLPMRPAPGLVAPRDDVHVHPSSADPTPPGSGSAPGAGSTRASAGTGAATAVVMVTVGGVMLVVGPAFMMIKIMDVYQRQKRLAKQLAQQDDPPPSYDEVAEKAPRYSALFQILENGELTAVCLDVEADATRAPSRASSEAPSAVTTDLSGVPSSTSPRRLPGTSRRVSSQDIPRRLSDCSEAEEEEADASTPLRSQDMPKKPEACNEDLSAESPRRKSV